MKAWPILILAPVLDEDTLRNSNKTLLNYVGIRRDRTWSVNLFFKVKQTILKKFILSTPGNWGNGGFLRGKKPV